MNGNYGKKILNSASFIISKKVSQGKWTLWISILRYSVYNMINFVNRNWHQFDYEKLFICLDSAGLHEQIESSNKRNKRALFSFDTTGKICIADI